MSCVLQAHQPERGPTAAGRLHNMDWPVMRQVLWDCLAEAQSCAAGAQPQKGNLADCLDHVHKATSALLILSALYNDSNY